MTARTRAREKAEAVVAALDALSDSELIVVHDHIADRLIRAGAPIPPLTTMRAEADAWAAIASHVELKTYIAAAVAHLSPADRAGLVAYLGKRA